MKKRIFKHYIFSSRSVSEETKTMKISRIKVNLVQRVIKSKQNIKETITNEAKSQISASSRNKRRHSEIKSINQ